MFGKRTLTAGAILLAGTIAAHAADVLPPVIPPAPPPPPPPPPVFSWAGPYVGIAGGYAWGETTWELTAAAGATPAVDFGIGTAQTWPISGWFLGAIAGYNFQFSNFVVGAELGYHLANIAGTATSVFGAADDVMTTQVSRLLTAVARVGFAMDNWLIYARGGYAGGRINADWEDTVGGNQGTWGPTSVWHHGFQLGAGVEVGLSNNLVLGLEYNFTRLSPAAHTADELPAGGTLTYDIGATFHSVGLRLSVLFGGP